MSASFPTTMGVRQGCPLSPTLFSLFVNDLEDVLEGGVYVQAGLKIKLLGYADDIVLVASHPASLQRMIYVLQEYCELWSLRINVNKSKIVVFKNGGRPAKSERWFLGKEPIEVVSSYRYLGMTLTSTLSMNQHLKEQVTQCKAGLNTVWRDLMANRKIRFATKKSVYNAVSRAVLSYGAQVWGGVPYEEAERFQRYFVKRVFELPQYTPSAFLYTEVGLLPVFIHTLKLHTKYIGKVLTMPDTRLPKIMALQIINKELYWFKELHNYAVKYSLENDLKNLALNNSGGFIELCKKIRCSIIEEFKCRQIEILRESTSFPIYKVLQFDEGKSFMNSQYLSTDEIRWLLKCRGDLFNLKCRVFRQEDSLCMLCSEQEVEDLFHFLAKCRALAEIRKDCLGEYVLTTSAIVDIVNGKDWKALAKYCKTAYHYRKSYVS